jgi:hypothetical protein
LGAGGQGEAEKRVGLQYLCAFARGA